MANLKAHFRDKEEIINFLCEHTSNIVSREKLEEAMKDDVEMSYTTAKEFVVISKCSISGKYKVEVKFW